MDSPINKDEDILNVPSMRLHSHFRSASVISFGTDAPSFTTSTSCEFELLQQLRKLDTFAETDNALSLAQYIKEHETHIVPEHLTKINEIIYLKPHTFVTSFATNDGLTNLCSLAAIHCDKPETLQTLLQIFDTILNENNNSHSQSEKEKNVGFNLVLSHSHTIQCICDIFESNDTNVMSNVLKLLTTICLFSDESFEIVIKALYSYGDRHNASSIFDEFVRSLFDQKDLNFRLDALRFINAVLNLSPDLKTRVDARRYLSELGFQNIMQELWDTVTTKNMKMNASNSELKLNWITSGDSPKSDFEDVKSNGNGAGMDEDQSQMGRYLSRQMDKRDISRKRMLDCEFESLDDPLLENIREQLRVYGEMEDEDHTLMLWNGIDLDDPKELINFLFMKAVHQQQTTEFMNTLIGLCSIPDSKSMLWSSLPKLITECTNGCRDDIFEDINQLKVLLDGILKESNESKENETEQELETLREENDELRKENIKLRRHQRRLAIEKKNLASLVNVNKGRETLQNKLFAKYHKGSANGKVYVRPAMLASPTNMIIGKPKGTVFAYPSNNLGAIGPNTKSFHTQKQSKSKQAKQRTPKLAKHQNVDKQNVAPKITKKSSGDMIKAAMAKHGYSVSIVGSKQGIIIKSKPAPIPTLVKPAPLPRIAAPIPAPPPKASKPAPAPLPAPLPKTVKPAAPAPIPTSIPAPAPLPNGNNAPLPMAPAPIPNAPAPLPNGNNAAPIPNAPAPFPNAPAPVPLLMALAPLPHGNKAPAPLPNFLKPPAPLPNFRSPPPPPSIANGAAPPPLPPMGNIPNIPPPPPLPPMPNGIAFPSLPGLAPPCIGGKKKSKYPQYLHKPKRKMNYFQWQQIKTAKPNTVWSEIALDKNNVNLINEDSHEQKSSLKKCVVLNIIALEESFGKSKDKKKSKQNSSESNNGAHKEESKKKKQKETLLDSKRSYNMHIALSRLKISHKVLKTAILALSEETLDSDQISKLQKLVPTTEEQELLKSWRGSDPRNLALAERFVYELKDIKCISQRLHFWQFKLSFTDAMLVQKDKIHLLQIAYNTIKTSESFKQFLQFVLLIGNYMNYENARKGNAHGFELKSLLSLQNSKSINKQQTLLTFIIKQCKANKMENALKFANIFVKDLSAVMNVLKSEEDSKKIDITQLATKIREFGKMRKDLAVLIRELKNNNDEDMFEPVMNEFLSETKEGYEELVDSHRKIITDMIELGKYFGCKKDVNLVFIEVLLEFSVSVKCKCNEISLIEERERKKLLKAANKRKPKLKGKKNKRMSKKERERKKNKKLLQLYRQQTKMMSDTQRRRVSVQISDMDMAVINREQSVDLMPDMLKLPSLTQEMLERVTSDEIKKRRMDRRSDRMNDSIDDAIETEMYHLTNVSPSKTPSLYRSPSSLLRRASSFRIGTPKRKNKGKNKQSKDKKLKKSKGNKKDKKHRKNVMSGVINKMRQKY